MKAYTISGYKQTHLKLEELPTPSLGAHDVLVQVHAASINPLDLRIKAGDFKLILPYQMPLTLGLDVAGVITQVGSQVTKFQVGDEIYACTDTKRIGTLAEYVAMDESDVALKPRNLTMVEAAAMPLVALTAWQALVENAAIKAGQKVFIQAGSGGVGSVAIQLAKHLGAEVATTASTKNFDWLRDLGADTLIDYKSQSFSELLHDYDAVLHSQDNKALHQSLEITKPHGQVISLSGPPTPEFAAAAGLPWYVKLLTRLLSHKVQKQANARDVTFTFLFMHASGEQLAQLGQLLESGDIRPMIDTVYPFSETNRALDHVASGRARGKVVVQLL